MEFLIEAELVQRMNGEDPIISLKETDLGGVDLDQEDLHGVDLENGALRDANLEGTTMSNGQKCEDWLKGKGGSEDDGENTRCPTDRSTTDERSQD